MRSRCRLKDPQFYALIPLNDASLEIWDTPKYGTKCWPDGNSPIKAENGHLQVPVLNGIRRDSTDGAFYIVAEKISFDEFRKMLVTCRIVE